MEYNKDLVKFYNQPPKYYIKLEFFNFIYEIKINRRLTILRGDSGTGKTNLLNVLDKYRRIYYRDFFDESGEKRDKKDFKLYTNSSFIVNPDRIEDIKNFEVVFYDEDHPLIESRGVISKLLNMGKFIVVITRRNFNTISYPLSEIYEWKTDIVEGIQYGYLSPIYLGDLLYESKIKKDYDLVITEDSGSGLVLFSKIFNNSTVFSSEGKDNIIKILKNLNKAVKILIIVDSANLGANIKEIKTEVSTGNIDLLLPESLEFLIIQSLIELKELKKFINEEIYQYSDIFDWNYEKIFTQFLQKSTKSLSRKNRTNKEPKNLLDKIVNSMYPKFLYEDIRYSKSRDKDRLLNDDAIRQIEDKLIIKEDSNKLDWR